MYSGMVCVGFSISLTGLYPSPLHTRSREYFALFSNPIRVWVFVLGYEIGENMGEGGRGGVGTGSYSAARPVGHCKITYRVPLYECMISV